MNILEQMRLYMDRQKAETLCFPDSHAYHSLKAGETEGAALCIGQIAQFLKEMKDKGIPPQQVLAKTCAQFLEMMDRPHSPDITHDKGIELGIRTCIMIASTHTQGGY